MINPPTFDEERKLHTRGYKFIAGIDEVGRGTIAGPVFASAVILPPDAGFPWLSMVRDSKQLSPLKRETIFEKIQRANLAVGIGMASHVEIDTQGIVKATHRAMINAVEGLPLVPDFLLIDALTLPDISQPQKGIIKGDQLSLSIACASIVAKVSRDRYMVELDKLYPGYGLAHHKGYVTKEHLQSLNLLGPCDIHRKSFEPVRSLMGK